MVMNKNFKNYNWYIKEDLSKYSGQWIAILDKKVIANDEELDKVMGVVKKKKALITKVNCC